MFTNEKNLNLSDAQIDALCTDLGLYDLVEDVVMEENCVKDFASNVHIVANYSKAKQVAKENNIRIREKEFYEKNIILALQKTFNGKSIADIVAAINLPK